MESDDSQSDPITDMVEVGNLFASSDAGSAVAAAERRLLCEPFGERAYRVHELRVAEFDGREVVIPAHNDAAVRI